jgi:hypothetical protein
MYDGDVNLVHAAAERRNRRLMRHRVEFMRLRVEFIGPPLELIGPGAGWKEKRAMRICRCLTRMYERLTDRMLGPAAKVSKVFWDWETGLVMHRGRPPSWTGTPSHPSGAGREPAIAPRMLRPQLLRRLRKPRAKP